MLIDLEEANAIDIETQSQLKHPPLDVPDQPIHFPYKSLHDCFPLSRNLFLLHDSQSSDPESASEGLSLKKVVIALKANKNPEKMLAEKEAFETYLSAQLGASG